MIVSMMYIALTTMQMIFSMGNVPEADRYISWNDFYYSLLSKGEVHQLIVRPDLNVVTITLHEGAVYKGKISRNRNYYMNIVDIKSFENKLREAEKSLGIRPENGIPVIYERSQENAWIILIALVALSLFSLMMIKSSNIKSLPPMDFFVINIFYLLLLCLSTFAYFDIV